MHGAVKKSILIMTNFPSFVTKGEDNQDIHPKENIFKFCLSLSYVGKQGSVYNSMYYDKTEN